MQVFHYTDKDGYNAIRAQPTWVFKAHRPPAPHQPFGAYFTNYEKDEPGLAAKLFLPKRKLAFLFEFRDAGDLKPIRGDRGRHVFYSPIDYHVGADRQVRHGPTGIE